MDTKYGIFIYYMGTLQNGGNVKKEALKASNRYITLIFEQDEMV